MRYATSLLVPVLPYPLPFPVPVAALPLARTIRLCLQGNIYALRIDIVP